MILLRLIFGARNALVNVNIRWKERLGNKVPMWKLVLEYDAILGWCLLLEIEGTDVSTSWLGLERGAQTMVIGHLALRSAGYCEDICIYAGYHSVS